ncbi:MAG: VTT domain-containing protein [Clostridia bacterium]|nr:VTT domain-containing protein [Clostridia bacterium]
MRKFGEFVLKILPFAVMAVLIVAVLSSEEEISVDTIMALMPDNQVLSALLILVMYALKSISVVFPIIVIQIAAGMIFPFWIALILNIAGTAIACAIPYGIGRLSGSAGAEKLMQKYPKIRDADAFQRNSEWFISFILRAVSCLPGDIVSMYLGSIGFKFIPYLTASVVGTLPGLVPATLVGINVTNPRSVAFIVSVAVTVVTSVGSVLIYYIIKKKTDK